MFVPPLPSPIPLAAGSLHRKMVPEVDTHTLAQDAEEAKSVQHPAVGSASYSRGIVLPLFSKPGL